MKRKNILFISSWYPSKVELFNGNFVQRHAEAVQLLNNVEVLHVIGDYNQQEKYIFEEEYINGIKTLIIYYKNSNNPIQNFFRRMKAYKMGFSKMEKPDIVHANILQQSMFFAVYLKKTYNIPFVISEHWSGFLSENDTPLKFSKIVIARIIASHASVILPVSERLKENLKRLKIGKRFEVVGNIINTQLFYPEKKVESPFVFLHISNLIPLKNPDSIIDCAIKLRNEFQTFELHIGGDGDYERLKNWVEKNNASDFIKVFGGISHEEVAEKMRKSHCFVLFSKYESFSCVLLESLSSGTPIITTDVGIVQELEEKSGIVIKNSEENLLNAMREMLLRNIDSYWPEHLHQSISDRYSEEKIAEHFDEVYQSVLGK